MQGVEDLLLALAAVSAALYLTMIAGFLLAMRRRRPPRVTQQGPRVSILKPLAGIDDELEESLSSFATLEYADYELVLSVASIDDQAYAVARKFVERMGPERARLVVTGPNAATNPKVAQLLSLERAAVIPAVLLLADCVYDPARELARSRVRACPRFRHRSGRAQRVAPRSRHGARMSYFTPASSCPDDTEHGHDRTAHRPASSRE
jgi:cellulose synthase/poly-beta-1,6-N-acetylglucosamine synthase-like glycosyltransferase